MTAVIGAGDPMLKLAELMLDNDNLRASLDEADLHAARAEQHAALEQQLHALHAAADDVRAGALFEGGLAIAGGAVSALGAGLETKIEANEPKGLAGALGASGHALTVLATPAGRLVGEVPRLHAEANAKQAEVRRTDAEARAEEARHHRDRMNDAYDRTTSAVGSALESEAQSNLALIANV